MVERILRFRKVIKSCVESVTAVEELGRGGWGQREESTPNSSGGWKEGARVGRLAISL